MSELKPCPFCGGEMYVCYTSATRAFVFMHKDGFAGCMFPEFVTYFDDYDINSLSEAAKAWNRRAK